MCRPCPPWYLRALTGRSETIRLAQPSGGRDESSVRSGPGHKDGASRGAHWVRLARRHLVEGSGLHVIDEAADLIAMGDERAGLDAGDRLAHVRVFILERLESKVWPDAGVGFDLGFDL